MKNIISKLEEITTKAPFYAIDTMQIERNIESFRDTFDRNITLLAAVKSNAENRLLEIISRQVDGFDISNAYEYEMISKYSQGKTISLTGPMWERFCRKKYERLIINCQSYKQFESALNFDNASIAIRVNVSLFTQNRTSLFGIEPDICKIILENNKNTTKGIHVHLNSKEDFEGFYDHLSNFIESLNFDSIEFVNFGGGYNLNDLQKIALIVNEIPDHVEVIFEPGQLFCTNSIYFVSKIVDIYHTSGIRVLISNGSMDSHLKWSSPEIVLDIDPIGKKIDTIIKGSSCYELDILAKGMYPESNFHVGKTIILKNISSYSLVWNCAFNGIQKSEVKFL